MIAKGFIRERVELSGLHVPLELTIPRRGVEFGEPLPKLSEFHETVKEIEQPLGAADIRLESFIVSNAPSGTMRMLWNMEKGEMHQRNIVFQEEDRDAYVRKLLTVAGS